jgi:hypothetical protein
MIRNIYSQYYFISFCVIHLFVTRTNLYQVSFTKQAGNESENNGSGKRKPKIMRQQSTEKYLLQSYRTRIPECLSHVGKTFWKNYDISIHAEVTDGYCRVCSLTYQCLYWGEPAVSFFMTSNRCIPVKNTSG